MESFKGRQLKIVSISLCSLLLSLSLSARARCSSLMGQDFTGSDGGTQYAYYLSLCGPLTSAAASTCTQIQTEASACQIQTIGGMQTFDIGNYDDTNPPTWSYVDDTKTAVQYNMTGAVQWSDTHQSYITHRK